MQGVSPPMGSPLWKIWIWVKNPYLFYLEIPLDKGVSLYDSNIAVNCLNVSEWFFWKVLYLTVSLSVQILCISRGSIPTYCHYIKICCGGLSPDPRNITNFLFFHCWSRGSVSVSPGEGVPSLPARKILHVGLHTLWSAFSHAVSQPKPAWRSAKRVNKKRIERVMC